jgi:hypothetical protein
MKAISSDRPTEDAVNPCPSKQEKLYTTQSDCSFACQTFQTSDMLHRHTGVLYHVPHIVPRIEQLKCKTPSCNKIHKISRRLHRNEWIGWEFPLLPYSFTSQPSGLHSSKQQQDERYKLYIHTKED